MKARILFWNKNNLSGLAHRGQYKTESNVQETRNFQEEKNGLD